jgi:riboflavin kinase / FMN adenylyltransferase
MRVLTGDPRNWPAVVGRSAVTIGVYDGVHRGHQVVLADLAEAGRVRGVAQTVVLTFDMNPAALVNPSRAPKMLTSLDRRVEILGLLGVDVVGILPFEEIRRMTPDEFIQRVLVDVLHAKLVVVGSDFRFGVDRSGDASSLRADGSRLGFDVDAVGLLRADGSTISSTAIRTMLMDGDVRAAAAALGRPYDLDGTVVAGEGRGRTLGYPTANLAVVDGIQLPADGVYAATAEIEGEFHPAIVNIGVRPTFEGTERLVETFLLDGPADLYGAGVRLRFVDRIRGERRFEGPEQLVRQIGRDIEVARSMLDE